MDQTPGFSGYKAAPQVFFFAPQNKWYLIFQTGPPSYDPTMTTVSYKSLPRRLGLITAAP